MEEEVKRLQHGALRGVVGSQQHRARARVELEILDPPKAFDRQPSDSHGLIVAALSEDDQWCGGRHALLPRVALQS
jgi:hypothetical protein